MRQGAIYLLLAKSPPPKMMMPVHEGHFARQIRGQSSENDPSTPSLLRIELYIKLSISYIA
jgi:hypothetical protein